MDPAPEPPVPRTGLGTRVGPVTATAVLSAPLPVALDAAAWPLGLAVLALGTAVARSGPLWRAVARRAGDRRLSRSPAAPWVRDRAWPETEVSQRRGRRARARAWFLLLVPVLAAWAFAIAVRVDVGRTGPATVPAWSPLALLGAGVLWGAVQRPGRRAADSVVVSWPELPQRTGGRVAFHVGTTEPHGLRIASPRFELRCVRERPGPFGGEGTAEVLWRGTFVPAAGLYVGPGAEVRAEFDVPPDAPPTDLHAREPVFWELVVVADVVALARRVAVGEPVLVPVYGPRD